MVQVILPGVLFIPLARIETKGGSVLHGIKTFDDNFPQFGECYFSVAKRNDPKAWKKHSEMICNLFVPHGEVKFVFFDDRSESNSENRITEFILSESNYGRLIIHPGIWFGFSGIGEKEESIIMNLSNIQHNVNESIRLEPDTELIPYTWSF
jgi:dTDP-4-dehydrorhamnose 3,5-epimerase